MKGILKFAGAALGLWAALCAPAFAQPPVGHQKFYSGPTTVNLAGRPVVADIALYTDRAAAAKGDLQVALVTDVTGFIDQTETDLKNWIAGRRADCGERWNSGDPLIAFPPGAIRFALSLEVEVWNCGLGGASPPSRMARETGRVDVTLQPYVEKGRLQARLGAFSISEQSGVNKYLPLEFLAKQALGNELKKLNENRKFHRPPEPLLSEGFEYESIRAQRLADGRTFITARYRAKGNAAALDRIAAKMRSQGVTQD